MQFKAIIFAAALMGATGAHAQITKSGPGYLFRVKWVKGQVLKYNFVMSGAMMPKGQSFVNTMTVKDVKNGIATVESKVILPQSGSSRNTKPTVTTIKLDNRGKIIGESSGQLNGAVTPTFPQGPVKVGQSWNGEISLAQGMKVNAVYTLTGVKSINGKLIAEVGQRISGSMGQMGTISGTGKVEFYAADGSMRSGNVLMNLLMKGSPDSKEKPKPMTFTTKITRL